MKNEPQGWIKVADELPPHEAEVLYRTAKYQSLGKLSADGKWRDCLGKVETHPVLLWAPIAAEHSH